MASPCPRCGWPTAFMSPVCSRCKPLFNQTKEAVCNRIVAVLHGPEGPLSREWDRLGADIAESGFPLHLYLTRVNQQCFNWLYGYQRMILAQGSVTAAELDHFHEAKRRLRISDTDPGGLTAALERRYAITEVRAGRLTQVSTGDIHLPLDERCFYLSDATRWKQLKARPVPIPGRILLTSKQMIFAALTSGGQIPWAELARIIQGQNGSVMVESTSSKLSGSLTVPDPEWFTELAMSLIRIERRQVLGSAPGRAAIPQHIKAEVWQRDGGRCRECGLDGSGGASLEFDHIIPIAKGGANSVGNLQVLCRTCNGRKSDRI